MATVILALGEGRDRQMVGSPGSQFKCDCKMGAATSGLHAPIHRHVLPAPQHAHVHIHVSTVHTVPKQSNRNISECYFVSHVCLLTALQYSEGEFLFC